MLIILDFACTEKVIEYSKQINAHRQQTVRQTVELLHIYLLKMTIGV